MKQNYYIKRTNENHLLALSISLGLAEVNSVPNIYCHHTICFITCKSADVAVPSGLSRCLPPGVGLT
ncbi:Hypothetical predicted protein [Octopus vulgaris]|uniref:Uncharacterized protein n=1 Tax=Octopus vulgaris TaxID=6645 RepID=A0AA36F4E5_OCTVU|nr:Hypothetical predicted protein [Octopus vulgaris]